MISSPYYHSVQLFKYAMSNNILNNKFLFFSFFDTHPGLLSQSFYVLRAHSCKAHMYIFDTTNFLFFNLCDFLCPDMFLLFFPTHQRPVRWTMCCSRQPQPSWRLWFGNGSCWRKPALNLCVHFSSPMSYRDLSK